MIYVKIVRNLLFKRIEKLKIVTSKWRNKFHVNDNILIDFNVYYSNCQVTRLFNCVIKINVNETKCTKNQINYIPQFIIFFFGEIDCKYYENSYMLNFFNERFCFHILCCNSITSYETALKNWDSIFGVKIQFSWNLK